MQTGENFHTFGNAHSVYITGLPYSFENSRVLYRAILWAACGEEILHKWFSTNYNVEVHAFVANGKYCVANNTYVSQDTTVCTDSGSFDLHLEANEIKWYNLQYDDNVPPEQGGTFFIGWPACPAGEFSVKIDNVCKLYKMNRCIYDFVVLLYT